MRKHSSGKKRKKDHGKSASAEILWPRWETDCSVWLLRCRFKVKPVQFASKALTTAKHGHSWIEKKGFKLLWEYSTCTDTATKLCCLWVCRKVSIQMYDLDIIVSDLADDSVEAEKTDDKVQLDLHRQRHISLQQKRKTGQDPTLKEWAAVCTNQIKSINSSKIHFLFCLTSCVSAVCGSTVFVQTWQQFTRGTSNTLQILHFCQQLGWIMPIKGMRLKATDLIQDLVTLTLVTLAGLHVVL